MSEQTTVEWLWIRNHPPTESGWYATTHCFDPEEGIFPGAYFWDGVSWIFDDLVWGTLPLLNRSSVTFPSKSAAEKWAYEHDPEGPTQMP